MMRKRRDARLRHSLAVLEHLSSDERELVRTAMETLVTACARARGDEGKMPHVANGSAFSANGHSTNGKSHSPRHRRATNNNGSRKSKSRAAL
jgi:hypothetical protein